MATRLRMPVHCTHIRRRNRSRRCLMEVLLTYLLTLLRQARFGHGPGDPFDGISMCIIQLEYRLCLSWTDISLKHRIGRNPPRPCQGPLSQYDFNGSFTLSYCAGIYRRRRYWALSRVGNMSSLDKLGGGQLASWRQ